MSNQVRGSPRFRPGDPIPLGEMARMEALAHRTELVTINGGSAEVSDAGLNLDVPDRRGFWARLTAVDPAPAANYSWTRLSRINGSLVDSDPSFTGTFAGGLGGAAREVNGNATVHAHATTGRVVWLELSDDGDNWEFTVDQATIGSAVVSGTPTRVLFIGPTGLLAEDSDFTYDASTDLLSADNIHADMTLNVNDWFHADGIETFGFVEVTWGADQTDLSPAGFFKALLVGPTIDNVNVNSINPDIGYVGWDSNISDRGRLLWFVNTHATRTLTLVHNSGTGTATMKMLLNNGANVVLRQYESHAIIYHKSTQRWYSASPPRLATGRLHSGW